jgi:hypothetical protein
MLPQIKIRRRRKNIDSPQNKNIMGTSKQLTRTTAMPNMPNAQPRAHEISGTYWTPPTQATMAEIHPLLMAVLIVIPSYQRWSLYSANVYDMASGGPLGYFDIAADPDRRRACGYYNSVGSAVVMRKPTWFPASGHADAVVQAFYEIVREAGHVD